MLCGDSTGSGVPEPYRPGAPETLQPEGMTSPRRPRCRPFPITAIQRDGHRQMTNSAMTNSDGGLTVPPATSKRPSPERRRVLCRRMCAMARHCVATVPCMPSPVTVRQSSTVTARHQNVHDLQDLAGPRRELDNGSVPMPRLRGQSRCHCWHREVESRKYSVECTGLSPETLHE